MKNITVFDEMSFAFKGKHMILLCCFVLHSFSKVRLHYNVYLKRLVYLTLDIIFVLLLIHIPLLYYLLLSF